MLRILHIFGQLERGGAELRTLELIESLNPREIHSDFLVLSGKPGSLDERARQTGARVIPCALTGLFPLRFGRVLRGGRYDVVHSHVHHFSGIVLFFAWLMGVPGRVTHLRSSTDGHLDESLRRRVQRKVSRFFTEKSSTHILAVSEGVMREAWSESWRSDPRCQVIYNGVPEARLEAVRGHQPQSTTIISVGTVHEVKNQLRVLEIFRECRARAPELKLMLVGRHLGQYAAQIRHEVESSDLKESVVIVGEVPEPLELMARAALMIMPSKWEGLPGAALEAAGLGLPVLGSDLPGFQEIGRFFPYVRTLSLKESNATWAQTALALISETVRWRTEAHTYLGASPFSLTAARLACHEVWVNAAKCA